MTIMCKYDRGSRWMKLRKARNALYLFSIMRPIEVKRSQLNNKNGVIFHYDNAGARPPLMTRNWESLSGKFWCIYRIARTLPHTNNISFTLYRTLKWSKVDFKRNLWKSLSSEIPEVLKCRLNDFTRKIPKCYRSKFNKVI